MRFSKVVAKVRLKIKAFPLGAVRKVMPLTQGQIEGIVKRMFVRGFTMVQVWYT